MTLHGSVILGGTYRQTVSGLRRHHHVARLLLAGFPALPLSRGQLDHLHLHVVVGGPTAAGGGPGRGGALRGRHAGGVGTSGGQGEARTRRLGVGRLVAVLAPITLKGAPLLAAAGRRAAEVRQSSQLSDGHADLFVDALSCVSCRDREKPRRVNNE